MGWPTYIILPKYKLVIEWKWKGNKEEYDITDFSKLLELNEQIELDTEKNLNEISMNDFGYLLIYYNHAIQLNNDTKWGIIFEFLKQFDKNIYIAVSEDEIDKCEKDGYVFLKRG